MHSTSTSSADWRKLIHLIRDVKIAMLTTRASDGTMHSRPLTTLDADDFDGALWFLIAAATREKAQEIARRPQVNLGYANPDDGKYVSVSGVAELVRDRARCASCGLRSRKSSFRADPMILIWWC